jgi:hypothetical protein
MVIKDIVKGENSKLPIYMHYWSVNVSKTDKASNTNTVSFIYNTSLLQIHIPNKHNFIPYLKL